MEPYQPKSGKLLTQLYVLLHFLLMIGYHVTMTQRYSHSSQLVILIQFLIVFSALSTFGKLLDGEENAGILELFRCIMFLLVEQYVCSNYVSVVIKYFYLASIVGLAVGLTKKDVNKKQL